jgi:AraC-like DNA-binding protein
MDPTTCCNIKASTNHHFEIGKMLTGLARLTLTMLDHATEIGADRDQVIRESGLDKVDLNDPEGRIPAITIERFWRSLMKHAPDPALGLRLGSSIPVREWGIVGYTMAYSHSLGEALHRLCRYSHILNQGLLLSLKEEEMRTTLVIHSELTFDGLQHPVDIRPAAVLRAAREITGVEIIPVEVQFPYPTPEDTSQHAHYFGCPLSFGCDETTIVLSREHLKLSVTGADEELCKYLDRLADEMMATLDQDASFVNKVRHVIWTELSDGLPTLQHTADTLGISMRALQRRLSEEDTTFAAVLRDLRREVAMGLIRHREMAVCEIAYLLGYSEPSTFHRAFRRWTGTSPREYRRTMT